jgi:nitroimidazol reductase NimA-like FMN-containing flavoprotein (pyridoxamine 5'-phosphate oxidase superfamily)
MKTKNLADLYKLDPVPWSRAEEALNSTDAPNGGTWFLATTRPDGKPHVAGVGALWDNGHVYVVSGPTTQKSRNLADNPNCAISVSMKGMDLVIDGVAERVTDEQTLQRMAARYAETGWPTKVQDGAFTYDYSAPSAGPPPWYLYRITPTSVVGVLGEAPGGATRWMFEG